MSDQTNQTLTAILDDTGHIAADLPCVNCGYNLRTLSATGICPECAAPVARSASGHYLHHAPARWVKRLASGALMMIVAIAVAVALGVVMIVTGIIIGTVVGQVSRGLEDALMILSCVFGAGAVSLIVIGLTRLTAPDPGSTFREGGCTARRLVRGCALALPVLVLSGWFLSPLPGVVGITPIPFFPGIHAFLLLVAFMILALAFLRHIATLMHRIPRPGLVTFAKIEFWFFLVATLVYVGGVGFLMFASLRMVPAFPGGPNMPTSGYAAGPNSLSVATTSAPAPNPSIYTYTSTPAYTVTRVGPRGVAVTTTTPTSGPVATRLPPSALPLIVASILSMVGGCTMFGVQIAGFVLLIMVWRALANTARLAEQNAPPNTT